MNIAEQNKMCVTRKFFNKNRNYDSRCSAINVFVLVNRGRLVGGERFAFVD